MSAPHRYRTNGAPVWGVRRTGTTFEIPEDEAREILTAHTPLVHHIITRYRYEIATEPYLREDLVAVGQVALLRSYQTWDPDRSKFATWAGLHIRQALSDFCRRARGQTMGEQRALMAARESRRNHTQLDAEILKVVLRVKNRRRVSLDANLQGANFEPSVGPLGDRLSDDRSEADVAEDLFWEQAQRWLHQRLSNGLLSDRERFILKERLAGRTLREIGVDLGVTRERVRQLESKAIDTLKKQAKRDFR